MAVNGVSSRWHSEEEVDDSQREDLAEAEQPPQRKSRWILPLRCLVVVIALTLAAVMASLLSGVLGNSGGTGVAPAKVSVPAVDTSAAPEVAVGSTAVGDHSQDGSSPQQILVHVAGAVKRPGIVKLAPGSRVFQALDAAGGATSDAELSAINLAGQVADGTQILVPLQGQKIAAGSASSGTSTSQAGSATGRNLPASGKVNINTATAAELDTLPGVGPVMAERIVSWRESNGPFTSVDALDAVQGIGPKLLARLRELVTL